jgi:hypothetical protein
MKIETQIAPTSLIDTVVTYSTSDGQVIAEVDSKGSIIINWGVIDAVASDRPVNKIMSEARALCVLLQAAKTQSRST